MANSRDLVRREGMLFTSRFLRRESFGSGGGRFPGDKLARKLGHLDGGETGFKSFVAAFEAGAINGLFESVAGQHTENYRKAGVHLRELQTACGFRANIIVVCGFAAQDAADGDEGIISTGGSKFFRGQRKFESAGNVDDIDVFVFRASATESVDGSRQQTIGNEAVEAAHHDAEAQTDGSQFAIN